MKIVIALIIASKLEAIMRANRFKAVHFWVLVGANADINFCGYDNIRFHKDNSGNVESHS